MSYSCWKIQRADHHKLMHSVLGYFIKVDWYYLVNGLTAAGRVKSETCFLGLSTWRFVIAFPYYGEEGGRWSLRSRGLESRTSLYIRFEVAVELKSRGSVCIKETTLGYEVWQVDFAGPSPVTVPYWRWGVRNQQRRTSGSCPWLSRRTE